MAAEVKYIQLEPAAFITDIDFMLMTAEERGVYCSIIFYLYANNGKIELNDKSDNSVINRESSPSDDAITTAGMFSSCLDGLNLKRRLS